MAQQTRLIIGAAYAFVFAIVHLALFRGLPTIGASGTWFYAGLLVLVLAVALDEPFFVTPSRAVLNGAALALTAAAFPASVGSEHPLSTDAILLGKACLFYGGILVAGVGVTAIMTKDGGDTARKVSVLATRLAGLIGGARVVFSALLLTAAFLTFGEDPTALGWVFATWVVVVIVRPLERLSAIRPASRKTDGEVVSIEAPGLVHARFFPDAVPVPGQEVDLGHGATGRVLDSVIVRGEAWALLATDAEQLPAAGASVRIRHVEGVTTTLGPVEVNTDLATIHFRLSSREPTVQEGSLVTAEIRDETVLYQVVDAEVRRLQLRNDLAYRYFDVTARKLGRWDDANNVLSHVAWLPRGGEPVSRHETGGADFDGQSIGVLPGSTYGIRVDIDSLVTHNTAILGILGVGKTYLAFELIRRTIASGVKVVVLDITGEYAKHFRALFPEWYEQQTYDDVEAATDPYHTVVQQNVHEGGSIQAFKQAINADLKAFLDSDYRLKIYEPDRFHVTRQDSKPYQNHAAMAPLTVAEACRILSEELLVLVRSLGLSATARVCLVLEEAHSLIPEWNSTTYEGDQRASNATSKAVLQGRKFGLGVLLVTQRTANVTKTVLNQCHTLFSLRSHDATGLEFMKNYVGNDFAGVLTTLAERRAVVFGKASACASPVIVQLNEHDDMLQSFWNPVEGDIPVPPADAPGPGPAQPPAPQDDAPF